MSTEKIRDREKLLSEVLEQSNQKTVQCVGVSSLMAQAGAVEKPKKKRDPGKDLENIRRADKQWEEELRELREIENHRDD